MAKQTFTTGQVLTAAQMTSLQQTAMGGGSPVAKTASYVLTAADAGTTIQMNSASSTTITVNTALFAAGDSVQIQNIGTGNLTITAGTATVNTAGGLAVTQWDGGFLYFTSTSSAIWFDYTQSGLTNPMTTTGDIIYASSGSTPARLGIGSTGQVLTVAGGVPSWATPASGSSFVGVSLYKTSNQSYSSGAGVNATFDAELYDTNNFHSTSVNTDRITIPSGRDGYYLLTARASWNASGTGTRIGQIRKNAAATALARNAVNNQTANVDCTMTFSTTVYLVATDYVVFENYQDGVGALDLIGSDQRYTSFSATYLGA